MLPDYQTFRAPADGGGWHRVGLSDKCKWSARTDASWIRLGNTWGWGQEPLWYGVNENIGSARTAFIEVVSESGTKRSIRVSQASRTPPADRIVTIPMAATLSDANPAPALRVFRSGVFQGYSTGFEGTVVSLQRLSTLDDPRSVQLSPLISAQALPSKLQVTADGAANSPYSVPIFSRLGNPCGVKIEAVPRSFGAFGGAGIITVTADAACRWGMQKSADWITLNLVGSASGTRLIPFSLASNSAAAPRIASIDIGGTVLSIDQAGLNQQQAFQDVPVFHAFATYIDILKRTGVTLGCGDGKNYCPDQEVTRGEMAAFLVRSAFGTDEFVYRETPYFDDVPATHAFFRHIQKLRELGITQGCTAMRYCADDRVTRGQMAAFLTRMKFGRSLHVLPGNGFEDATDASGFRVEIEKMKEQGITSGCSLTQYCPASFVTRGQMAAFLIRAFFAP